MQLKRPEQKQPERAISRDEFFEKFLLISVSF